MKHASQTTQMQARIQAWCPSANPVVVRSAHAVLVSLFGDAITRKVGTKPVPSGFKRGPS
jgi:hypothetical protein